MDEGNRGLTQPSASPLSGLRQAHRCRYLALQGLQEDHCRRSLDRLDDRCRDRQEVRPSLSPFSSLPPCSRFPVTSQHDEASQGPRRVIIDSTEGRSVFFLGREGKEEPGRTARGPDGDQARMWSFRKKPLCGPLIRSGEALKGAAARSDRGKGAALWREEPRGPWDLGQEARAGVKGEE